MEKRYEKNTTMIKIENGIFKASNFSFIIPNGFCLKTVENGIWEFCKNFNGTDVAYIIAEYYYTEYSEEEELDSYKEDMEVDNIGEYFKVKRGKGEAIAAFFGNKTACDYIEKYKFKQNADGYNIFSITVEYHTNASNARTKLKKLMDTPEVKIFLDSIQYS